MKPILIITYYWPPISGAAAQRLSAFARYLPAFGYRPLVLTAPIPDAAILPGPCDINVFTVRGRDPSTYRNRLQAPSDRVSITAPPPPRWMEWIRLNLFVPDAKIGWRRPAIRTASEIIAREHPVALFTSAPPYTVHRVGLALKRRFGLPWIADFRDPWLENHAYNTQRRLRPVLWLNRRMESAVLRQADHITTALDSQRRLLTGKLPERDANRVTTIRNGFNPEAFPPARRLLPADRFYLSHFGTVYEAGFNWTFFDRLADCVQNDSDYRKSFVLQLAGTVPQTVQHFLRQRFAPQHLAFEGTLAHRDILKLLARQRVLLLLVNHGTLHRYSLPSKVYEYMASGQPVLGVGPSDHESMDLLRASYADRCCLSDAETNWKPFLRQQFDAWQQGRLPAPYSPPKAYDHRNLTGQLATCINRLSPSCGPPVTAAPGPGTSRRCTNA